MTTKAEPRFDIDLSYGKRGEELVGTFLEWIMKGTGQIEVKRKKYLDRKFYVETHCDRGRKGNYLPSGILTTTATAWAIVFGSSNVCEFVPTALLREMLDDPSTQDREEFNGECPTKGRLIDLNVLLYRCKQKLTQVERPLVASCVHMDRWKENGVCSICRAMGISA